MSNIAKSINGFLPCDYAGNTMNVGTFIEMIDNSTTKKISPIEMATDTVYEIKIPSNAVEMYFSADDDVQYSLLQSNFTSNTTGIYMLSALTETQIPVSKIDNLYIKQSTGVNINFYFRFICI